MRHIHRNERRHNIMIKELFHQTTETYECMNLIIASKYKMAKLFELKKVRLQHSSLNRSYKNRNKIRNCITNLVFLIHL